MQDIIKKNDAHFLDPENNIIQCITKKEYFNKYKNLIKIKKKEILFSNGKNEIDKKKFFLNLDIKKIELIKKYFKYISIDNIKQIIEELKMYKTIMEKRRKYSIINIKNRILYEEIVNETNIDLNKELHLILSKIKKIFLY